MIIFLVSPIAFANIKRFQGDALIVHPVELLFGQEREAIHLRKRYVSSYYVVLDASLESFKYVKLIDSNESDDNIAACQKHLIEYSGFSGLAKPEPKILWDEHIPTFIDNILKDLKEKQTQETWRDIVRDGVSKSWCRPEEPKPSVALTTLQERLNEMEQKFKHLSGCHNGLALTVNEHEALIRGNTYQQNHRSEQCDKLEKEIKDLKESIDETDKMHSALDDQVEALEKRQKLNDLKIGILDEHTKRLNKHERVWDDYEGRFSRFGAHVTEIKDRLAPLEYRVNGGLKFGGSSD